MLRVEYAVFDNKTLEVSSTNFTEEEAFFVALALSERENKKYSVAKIIAETEQCNVDDWELCKRDESKITIKQSFKTSEFKPKGEE